MKNGETAVISKAKELGKDAVKEMVILLENGGEPQKQDEVTLFQ